MCSHDYLIISILKSYGAPKLQNITCFEFGKFWGFEDFGNLIKIS
jgi:hypothetical protein